MSKRHFVCTDAKNNNNKYWNVEWDETTGNATVTYGREIGRASCRERV